KASLGLANSFGRGIPICCLPICGGGPNCCPFGGNIPDLKFCPKNGILFTSLLSLTSNLVYVHDFSQYRHLKYADETLIVQCNPPHRKIFGTFSRFSASIKFI